MLTLVSLDKIQNISIRNLRTGHFESYLSEIGLSPPVKYFYCLFQVGTSLVVHFMLFLHCFCHAFASAHCCLVVTCWEKADLLAIICGVKLCGCFFPIWYPGSGWYLILSIPDLCPLSYFHTERIVLHISAVLFQ